MPSPESTNPPTENQLRPPEEQKQPTGNDKPRNLMLISVVAGLVLLVLSLVAFLLLSRNQLSASQPIFYLVLGIAALIVIIGVVFVVLAAKGKIERKEPDYKTFFIMGIIWVPLGLVLDNPALWIIGLVFMALGLKNKNKWKDQPKWNELPAAQKNLKLALIIALLLMVVLGVVAFYLTGR